MKRWRLLEKGVFLVASLCFCFYYQTIECVYAKKIDPQLEGTDYYVRTTVIKHPFSHPHVETCLKIVELNTVQKLVAHRAHPTT